MQNIVVLGVTGDLAKKRLLPALARAWVDNGVSKDTRFFGFGRKPFLENEFRNFVLENVYNAKVDLKSKVDNVNDFLSSWSYVQSELDDIQGFKKLKENLKGKSKVKNKVSTFIYLALPPAHQYGVIKNLLSTGILKRNNGTVLAIEKPFGSDKASALKLYKFVVNKVSDNQLFIVDHYSAKEEFMNIEERGKRGEYSAFNSKTINKIQVRFLEKNSASGRGAFYDKVGASKDVVQNHLIHMLGTVLAAPYAGYTQYSKIRAYVTSYIQPTPGHIIFGQYESYKNEMGVAKNTTTETYVRTQNIVKFPKMSNMVKTLKVSKVKSVNVLPQKIYTDIITRWQGLHVEFCTGKVLSDDLVDVCFEASGDISSFCVVTARHGSKDAYQTIFETVMKGDMSRSVGIQQVISGWKYLERVHKQKIKFVVYKDGSRSEDIF